MGRIVSNRRNNLDFVEPVGGHRYARWGDV